MRPVWMPASNCLTMPFLFAPLMATNRMSSRRLCATWCHANGAKYVLILGGDNIVPFFRVPDRTPVAAPGLMEHQQSPPDRVTLPLRRLSSHQVEIAA